MLLSALKHHSRGSHSLSLAMAFSLAWGFFPAVSHGHPLGNFTVNHFSRLEIYKDHVQVEYVIDLAEIPAFQEMRGADTDGDGKTSRPELDTYLDRVAPTYVEGLSLTTDGKPIPLKMISGKIITLPGAGGLSTLRLEYKLQSQWNEPGSGVPRRLRFADSNQQDRIGWHEIVITPSSGVTVFNSTAFSNSVTDELRNYPTDMLASPLEERGAELSWVVGPAPVSSSILSTRDGPIVGASRDRLGELIAVRQLTPGVALLGLLIAAVLGAAHALSPGHGKTVVGAYLVGSRGTPRHAVFLGLTVTVTHTAGVFALGFITLFASRYILPERLFPILSLISGALVAVIGFKLFLQRLGLALAGLRAHSHEALPHEHHAHLPGAHTHSHGGREHSHVPVGTDGDVTWRSLLALGISGGLLPCPSALVVLLSAIAIHRVGYGLALVVAFSLGLAATLTAIGLAFVFAGRWLSRFGPVPRAASIQRIVPVFSAFVVACLGFALCYGAIRQAGFNPLLSLSNVLSQWGAVLSGQRPLKSMGALAVLAFGLILGFKHAMEADHIVAVSSIVSEHRKIAKVALVGGLWGLGHTVTLVFVGIIVLALGIAIPERVSQYLEFAVGLMIIGLSGTALARVLRGRTDVHIHRHDHGVNSHSHLHFHEHGAEHDHSLKSQGHAAFRVGFKPLIVGAVHGLAGSAALTLLVLTQVRSMTVGISYLLLFGIGSIFGMMTVSTMIGVPFALSASRLTRITVALQVTAGLVGVAFGCWYAYSVGSTAFA